MNVDLNLLKAFLKIAELKSLSKASLHLHLSQPALSLQMGRLEEQFGKKLFDRHNRGLIPTAFGKELILSARKIIEIEKELEQLTLGSPSEPSGTLRIGTYTTISSYLLPKAMKNFLKKCPQVCLSFQYQSVQDILSQIKGNLIDAAILSDVPADPSLDAQVFLEDELVLAKSVLDPQKTPRAFAAKDLAKINYLSYPLRSDLCYKKVEKRFGAYLAKSHLAAESESFDTLKQMLLHGLGMTFIPKYLISDEIKKGSVQVIPVGGHRLPIHFSFVTKKGVELPLGLRTFRDSVFDIYSPKP